MDAIQLQLVQMELSRIYERTNHKCGQERLELVRLRGANERKPAGKGARSDQ